MIKIKIGTNTRRDEIVVDPNTTLRTALESKDINYSAATVTLDGCPLQPGELDKTFSDFNITTSCYLLAVVKSDNA